MMPNQSAAFKQIPAYLADMAPGDLEFGGLSDEQRERVYTTSHPQYLGSRIWTSVLTDEDGEQLRVVFLDYHEDGTVVYWGTFDV